MIPYNPHRSCVHPGTHIHAILTIMWMCLVRVHPAYQIGFALLQSL